MIFEFNHGRPFLLFPGIHALLLFTALLKSAAPRTVTMRFITRKISLCFSICSATGTAPVSYTHLIPARDMGLKNVVITNGSVSLEVLDEVLPGQ